jgi:hypothetical protein
MKEQPLLVIIIVGNDVYWRCTSSHLARWWSWSKLFCLLIEKCFQVLGTVALQLLDDLHCLLILLLPEFHLFSSGVQFLGEHSGKIHLLLELEVAWIRYRHHMDVGRSTRSLGKASTFHSVQELVMARTSDHVGLVGSIRDSGVEGMSWVMAT